ncbi:ADP-forming succinate--CoA ligase subunit beta [Candidatus Woesearchaeota archaeon CG11_big_fil_rev_8_21_14_0_20_43_8]|nr:MAG: ADP-forming succinate--CoA ligase subunit beta [Candidatus Woesearchaeota archaeon CG11_big_fil_rev_8_21_14_0_20_43_8]PIO05126.1 MAG: ADP-forming succinate--CoA ligase subunit beta [Candidatus Woesearchaeota archaeon CG08_land_8_20_14_0_20_43_7]
MKLKEHQGKEILRRYSIPVPKGYLAKTPDEALAGIGDMQDVVLKAQVLVGGRGKAGGIKPANRDDIHQIASGLFGMDIKGLKVDEVLVEEKLNIQKEMFLSLTVNRSERNITLIFSDEGGVNIEELSQDDPEKIHKFGFHTAEELKEITESLFIQPIAISMFSIMKDLDCELVEINPLVLANDRLVAADAKVIIDDNSLFRHEDLRPSSQKTELEKEAAESGLSYVELDGDIAIIGNGAGLVMATLDVVDHFGGRCANFLDVGGGASVERMKKAMDIVLRKDPKGLLINIFGGITRCDEIARGIVGYRDSHSMKIPIVVRMIGTNEDIGKIYLDTNGLHSLDSMEECAKTMVDMLAAK